MAWTENQKDLAWRALRADLDSTGHGNMVTDQDIGDLVEMASSAGSREAAFPLFRKLVSDKAGFFARFISDKDIHGEIDRCFKAAEG